MTLYTAKDFDRNLAARISTVNLIDSHRQMVALHTEANRNVLAKNAQIRLAEAEYQLYRLNKDYDEMMIASMQIEFPERKSFIKKLLRK